MFIFFFNKLKIAICSPILAKGPSINDFIHLGGGGSAAKRLRYSISLFSKIGEKGEGGVKNLQEWMTSFMEGPKE